MSKTPTPTVGREDWDQAAAAWNRWADLFAQRVDGPAYVELGRIRDGSRVLEIGCGAGDQTLVLARTVGPSGEVVATDVSEAMLEVARRRVEAEGLTNVTFAAGDAASLDVESGGFDAAVAGFVLMLVADPDAAAASVRRLLAPGARFVASVWSSPPSVPMLSLPVATVIAEVGGPPPDPTGPGLFALADRARLEQVLAGAGFRDVTVDTFEFPFGFPSAGAYAAFIREIAPMLSRLVDERAPGRADEVWEQVAAAAHQRAAADGSVLFANEALFAVGTAPG